MLIIVKHVLQPHVSLSKKVQDNSLSLLMESPHQLFVILDASSVLPQVLRLVSHVKMVTIYLQLIKFVLHVPPHAKHAVLLQQHVLLVMLMHSFLQQPA